MWCSGTWSIFDLYRSSIRKKGLVAGRKYLHLCISLWLHRLFIGNSSIDSTSERKLTWVLGKYHYANSKVRWISGSLSGKSSASAKSNFHHLSVWRTDIGLSGGMAAILVSWNGDVQQKLGIAAAVFLILLDPVVVYCGASMTTKWMYRFSPVNWSSIENWTIVGQTQPVSMTYAYGMYAIMIGIGMFWTRWRCIKEDIRVDERL